MAGGGGQERRRVLVELPAAGGGVGGRRGVQVVVVVVVVHLSLALPCRHSAAQRSTGVVVGRSGGGWRGRDGRRGRRRRRHAEDACRDDVDNSLWVPVAGVLGGVDRELPHVGEGLVAV